MTIAFVSAYSDLWGVAWKERKGHTQMGITRLRGDGPLCLCGVYYSAKRQALA